MAQWRRCSAPEVEARERLQLLLGLLAEQLERLMRILRRRAIFLDFDDLVVGPAVQDVWMLLPGRDAEGARQRGLLVDAYRQFRDFDESWLRLIEPLRAFRFVFYAAWIARRWEDPAFPAAFPHFGTPTYWENETRDLEEHVERLLRGAGAVPGRARPEGRSEAPEDELTNEDFFWDL